MPQWYRLWGACSAGGELEQRDVGIVLPGIDRTPVRHIRRPLELDASDYREIEGREALREGGCGDDRDWSQCGELSSELGVGGTRVQRRVNTACPPHSEQRGDGGGV